MSVKLYVYVKIYWTHYVIIGICTEISIDTRNTFHYKFVFENGISWKLKLANKSNSLK